MHFTLDLCYCIAGHCVCLWMPPHSPHVHPHQPRRLHCCLTPCMSGEPRAGEHAAGSTHDRHRPAGLRLACGTPAGIALSWPKGTAVAIGFGDRTLTVCGASCWRCGGWAPGSGCASSLCAYLPRRLAPTPRHPLLVAKSKPACRWDHAYYAGGYELTNRRFIVLTLCKLMALVAKLHTAIATSSERSAVFRVKGGRQRGDKTA